MTLQDAITAQPEQAVLKNGMHIFSRKTSPSGLVSVQVWVKTGSIHEGEHLGGGLSHYVEHMVFKGTKNYSGKELTDKIQSVGGLANAYTTFDRTVYYIDIPSDKVEIAFLALSEMLIYPKFDKADAAGEKEVILREISMGEDEPDRRLSDASFAEAFHVHPYRIPVIGYKEVFSKIGVKELSEYFRSRYTPDTMNIVVAGDVDFSAVVSLSEKYFGALGRGFSTEPFVPAEPAQMSKRIVALTGDVNVLRGGMIWKIPGFSHEDAAALGVLSSILGHGDSAVLYRELHEELGIVHAIDVSQWAPSNEGMIWVSYLADCGTADRVEKAVKNTIAKIVKNGVSQNLIKKTIRQSLVGIMDSRKSVKGAANRLGIEAVVLGDVGATKSFVERVMKVTSDDIRRVAAKYFIDERLTTALLDKEKRVSKAAAQGVRQRHGHEPFELVELKNGVRILLQNDYSVPKIHLRALMLGGGAYEKPGLRGSSAMLSTMLTMDTKTMSVEKVAETVESLGGTFDDVSGTNTVGLAVEMLSEDADTARKILRNALLTPKFVTENFDRELNSQVAALGAEMDDIVEFSRIKMLEKFFGKKHFLGTHNYGTLEDLSKMTVDDVKLLYRKIVRPENLVIAVSGDFDRKDMLKKLTADFEDFSPAGNTFVPASRNVPKRSGEGKLFEVKRDAEQLIVELAFPSVGFSDSRMIVVDIINELLSGMGSQLFNEVREKRGMAYFVASNSAGSPGESVMYVYAGTRREYLESVLKEMKLEIKRIREGKISAEEFQAAKTRISVSRRTMTQLASVRAEDAGLNVLYGLPVNYGDTLDERLKAVSIEDLKRFGEEFLDIDDSLTFVGGPAE